MKKYFLLPALILAGCRPYPAPPHVTVKLTDDDKSVQITGFDKAVIDEIGHDTTRGVWQGLLPVYKMPADTDMKDFQNAQPGKYVVKDSLVIFTPDTAFKKGQNYFVRYFDYESAKSAWQAFGEKKRLGAARHRDLMFRY